MTDASDLTDREVLDVFARNLRQLTREEPSISHLCRQLGINRSQFNRYLNGSSGPRPLVLRRICDYFKTDARILFEPLGQIQRNEPNSRTTPHAAFSKPASETLFPDGIYSTWAQSTVYPGKIRYCPLRVQTINGVRFMRLKTPSVTQLTIPGTKNAPRITSMTGAVFQQGSGIAIVARDIQSDIIFFHTFSPGFTANDNCMFGIGTSGASLNPRWRNSVTNCVIEPLPNNPLRRASVIRTPRIVEIDRIPRHVLGYLELAGSTISYR